MKNEKVYIEGRVVGSFADTLGSKGKQIHLISGDIVDVDDSFIIESIEPKTVKVPQFVAEIIEYYKKQNATLYDALREKNFNKKYNDWLLNEQGAYDKVARAWLDGYEVEKEKRYLVKVKGVNGYGCYLNKGLLSKEYFFESKNEIGGCRTKHTRKQLEDDDFGWVFDCEGIEIEEVTE